jgi:diaminopimelate epimerase
MRAAGRPFFKMSGSGNDFVIVDARQEAAGELREPATIRRVCARATGVGADGIVLLEPSTRGSFRMTYFNSDGSLASLCGNASLCSARLAVDLGAADAAGFEFETDAGTVRARLRDGLPEIDLQPVRTVRADAEIALAAGERQIGFALAGVPHLIVRCDEIESVDVPARGATLRRHPGLADGANVNFVAPESEVWAIRTFERGVEGETLACGTGAVAAAVLLAAWGESGAETAFRTRSGRVLSVRLTRSGDAWLPSLSGEGRLVFEGRQGEL